MQRAGTRAAAHPMDLLWPCAHPALPAHHPACHCSCPASTLGQPRATPNPCSHPKCCRACACVSGKGLETVGPQAR